jgi:hypothetical protein
MKKSLFFTNESSYVRTRGDMVKPTMACYSSNTLMVPTITPEWTLLTMLRRETPFLSEGILQKMKISLFCRMKVAKFVPEVTRSNLQWHAIHPIHLWFQHHFLSRPSYL